ncbi:MAG: hypothetical protein O7G83_12405 [Proteobacteria bacterium]|nr:hypothetical protein [Pseudomonadota bacterium]
MRSKSYPIVNRRRPREAVIGADANPLAEGGRRPVMSDGAVDTEIAAA